MLSTLNTVGHWLIHYTVIKKEVDFGLEQRNNLRFAAGFDITGTSSAYALRHTLQTL